MPKIPQDTIDKIRDQADIVDIISQDVELKRKGINYFGVCPFHDEKTPSFSVSPSKQIYPVSYTHLTLPTTPYV